ncbi:MAG: dynamin family protein [Pseudomonadota bacterium]
MKQLDNNSPKIEAEPTCPRRPRVALMGEFSAGKSTLANLMIGTDPLPVQVVSTQLPPVWISHGHRDSALVDLEGNETTCDLDEITSCDPADIAYVRYFRKEEILERCDIIDMPGISDPNMAAEAWQRVMPFADAVVWCSPATQAWRQSEAAVWETVEPEVQELSMLVITRGDMLLNEKDKTKVLRRVKAQAGDQFAHVTMMSLTLAREAENDDTLWLESGADDFVDAFLKMLDTVNARLRAASGEDGAHVNAANQSEEPDWSADTVGQVTPRRPVARQSKKVELAQDALQPGDPTSFVPKFS